MNPPVQTALPTNLPTFFRNLPPLMSRREETRAALKLKQMNARAEALEKSKHPAAPILRRQTTAARNAFAARNIRLVLSVAKKYRSDSRSINVGIGDLVQEGTMGLLTAVDRFDPSLAKFSTFAVWWIRQAILRNRRENDDMAIINIPNHAAEVARLWFKLEEKTGESTHNKTAAELVKVAGKYGFNVSEDMVRGFFSASTISDERQSPADASLTPLTEQHTDTRPDPEKNKSAAEVRLRLNGAILRHLTQREQVVITLRFGLHNDLTFNLAELGQMLNLSRERVRQIEQRALAKLRREAELREYVVV